jgi:nucleotide-binding universal stress UspA family protein
LPWWETEIAEADAYLSGPASYLTKEAVKVNNEVVLSENVTSAILDYAARIEANLIAIATSGSGGMSRLMFGTVADEVTRKSPTSLLVFHPKPEAATSDAPQASEARALAGA